MKVSIGSPEFQSIIALVAVVVSFVGVSVATLSYLSSTTTFEYELEKNNKYSCIYSVQEDSPFESLEAQTTNSSTPIELPK